MAEPFNYPQFDADIDALRKRLGHVKEEHQPLISKWITRLVEMDDEMRHLERLEKFTFALHERHPNDE